MTNDYKSSPEAKAAALKYADIIKMPRPVTRKPHMDLIQRAKIFAPYDALRGFDEAIEEINELYEEEVRSDLSEEEKEHISQKLRGIRKGMHIRIRHFAASSGRRGNYIITEGIVKRSEPAKQIIEIQEKEPDSTGRKIEKVLPVAINFNDIVEIETDDPHKLNYNL